MKRAEEIKAQLNRKATSAGAPLRSAMLGPLKRVSSLNATMSAGLKLAEEAVQADETGDAGTALKKYESCLSTYLAGMKEGTDGETRKLVYSFLEKFMSRAEKLKKALK